MVWYGMIWYGMAALLTGRAQDTYAWAFVPCGERLVVITIDTHTHHMFCLLSFLTKFLQVIKELPDGLVSTELRG